VKNNKTKLRLVFFLKYILPLTLILIVYVWFRLNLPDKSYYGSDFQNYYNESVKLLNGDSIYSRILTESITIQSEDPTAKYATAFPIVYIVIGLVSMVLKYSGTQMYMLLHNSILVVDFITGIVIFLYTKKRTNLIIAYFSIVFWLFNRWTSRAYVKTVIDPIPLMFLILSLYYFETKKKLSAGFLALSILLKHFGLFLLPFYFVAWYKKRNYKELIILLSLAILPLIVTSFPFVVKDYKGFIFSVGFNLTRQQDPDFHLPFLDQIYYQSYQVTSMASKLMTIMMGKLYFFGTYMLLLAAFIYSKRSLTRAVGLVFIWFFFFHSVYLAQYNIWMVGAILLNTDVFLSKFSIKLEQ